MYTHFKKTLRHIFVPGRHNNHQASSVSHASLTAYLCLAMVSFVILRNLAAQTGNVLGFATDVSTVRLMTLTNEQRVAKGLNALVYNPQLAAAAAAKAQDMFAKGYWAHFGPNGESPWNFILAAGYQYDSAGENLAKNYVSSNDVVNAWMNSPTHRDNILKPSYEEVGFAVVNGSLQGEDTTLVVQMFGSRIGFEQSTPNQQSKPESSNAPIQVAAVIPTITPLPTATRAPQVLSGSYKGLPVSTDTNIDRSQVKVEMTKPTSASPSLNLYPAFRIIIGILIALLIGAFVIDFYYISKSEQYIHRGKHIAHLIFLVAILIAMFFLGRGSIM
ncbi:MAG: CAP domain-containing protein [Candidatus Roizmanbacteria bacterium]